MAKSYEVLAMLIPQGGWTTRGNSYEDVEFIEAAPISKAEFEAGFAKYDAWKAEQDAKAIAAKAAAEAKLAAIGITAEDLKALGL